MAAPADVQADVTSQKSDRAPPHLTAQRWPAWARWNDSQDHRFTIGAEEEVFVLSSGDHSPVQASEWVRRRLPADLAAHTSPETHASVIELTTGTHDCVADAAAELLALRCQLVGALAPMELSAASSGTHPMAALEESRVVDTVRYRAVANSMRMLARREPTLALHVHVGVPDPQDAVRLLNGLRDNLPVLLALSANSPFCAGTDSGFASARTVIFQGFPRTGAPRHFASYEEYVRIVDALVASGAVPDPTFLWWDLRLQPSLGTVEVRIMDAQTAPEDTAALVALVDALARLVLEHGETDRVTEPEVLAENRFLAARDGLAAHVIDPATQRLVPVRTIVERLLDRCLTLGDRVSSIELARVRSLVAMNGADRQRACAVSDGLPGLMAMLTGHFAPTSPDRPASQSVAPEPSSTALADRPGSRSRSGHPPG